MRRKFASGHAGPHGPQGCPGPVGGTDAFSPEKKIFNKSGHEHIFFYTVIPAGMAIVIHGSFSDIPEFAWPETSCGAVLLIRRVFEHRSAFGQKTGAAADVFGPGRDTGGFKAGDTLLQLFENKFTVRDLGFAGKGKFEHPGGGKLVPARGDKRQVAVQSVLVGYPAGGIGNSDGHVVRITAFEKDAVTGKLGFAGHENGVF